MASEHTRNATTARTGELRRAITARSEVWPRLIRSRTFVLALVIWGLFVVVCGLGAIWARQRPMLAVGRVVDQTRTVRTQFDVRDTQATDQLMAAERQRAPRVYQEVEGVLDELTSSVAGLPLAIADVEKLEDVDAGLREQFRLTSELITAVKAQIADAGNRERWAEWTLSLRRALENSPLVDQQTYQVEVTAVNERVELRSRDRRVLTPYSQGVRSVESNDLRQDMETLAASAGFSGPSLVVVTNRLMNRPRATYVFDAAATAANQKAYAEAVVPVMITYPDRAVIFRRGDVLTASQFETYKKAEQAERDAATWWSNRLEQAATVGVVGTIALALAGYTGLFCGRIRRDVTRMAGVAAVMASGALVAWWTTSAQPGLIAMTSVAPTLFVSVMLAIAYDRRTALALGALHGVLVCVGLDTSIGTFAVIVTGVGVAMWCLDEVRDRDTLIRTGMVTGIGLAAVTMLVGLITFPLMSRTGSGGAWVAAFEQLFEDRTLVQIARDAGLAGFAGPLVAAVTLFILPSIERWFDITTGMTLVELRDPKNPLLRMLQQRAPGTYNHSLNLASLAEAAADAIGADSLLTYVGALYHDIGKMNKPEYFVENQSPGINKHDKLSPAMSLLIIVGHVKDGMELAREFSLPRPLWHFIESHHGTTLVEYFFHRAKKQAEREALIAGMSQMEMSGLGMGGGSVGMSGGGPSEIEYRYPGPKPKTKEAAIIMLCDAVESASRAMADPTPARIDATVRAIANKRLMDGQFDDCDLTLRELNVMVGAVSKTLAAIYHGRIAYPTGPTARGGVGGPPSGIPTMKVGVMGSIGSASSVVEGGTHGGTTLLVSPKTGTSAGGTGNGAAALPSTKLPEGAPRPEQGAKAR